MPINEYEELVSNVAKDGGFSKSNPEQESPTPAPDSYDDVVASVQEVQKGQLQQSMYTATRKDPERSAQVLDLAQKTGLPAGVVERRFDMVKQKHADESFDYDNVIRDTPELAKFMQDPEKASVSHDDIEHLGGMEKSVQDYTVMQSMMGALNTGLANVNQSLSQLPTLAVDLALTPGNLFAKAIGREDLQSRAPDWLANNPVSKFYKDVAKEYTPPDLERSVYDEIKKGNYSRAGRTMAAQFVSNAPQQAITLAATLSGYGLPSLVFSGATTAATTLQESRDAGATPLQSITNAAAAGTIESSFESLGTLGVLHHWEGAITKSFGKESAKQVFKDFAKTIAYSVAAEGNEEFLTSIAQDYASYATGVNPDAMKGSIGRAVDAGLVGGFSGGLMTSPSAIIAGHVRNRQAKQAAMSRDFYLALGEQAQNSKLKERLPQAQQQFVEQLTKDGPVQNVFIPVEDFETYFQKKGIDPVKAASDVGASKAFDDSKATGADIEIPLANMVSKLAPEDYTGLANDIKFHPEGVTANQAVADKKAAQEALQVADSEAVEPGKLADQSAKDVMKAFEGQLKEAGIDTKNAPLLKGIVNLAVREGIDPMALYQELNIKINNGEGVDVGGQTFNQSMLEQSQSLGEQKKEFIDFLKEKGVPVVKDQLILPSLLKKHGASEEMISRLKEYNDPKNNPPQFGKVFRDELKTYHQKDQQAQTPLEKLESEGWQFNVSFDPVFDENGDQVSEDKNKITVFAEKQGVGGMGEAHFIKDGKNWVADDTQGDEGVKVTKELRGQGIATAIYQAVERDTKKIIKPSSWQTEGGKGLWSQEARPFGNDKPYKPGRAFNQNEEGVETPLGQIQIGKNGINIQILEKANASTFIHETGHLYLEVLGRLASREGASEQTKEDHAKILNWFGVESADQITTDHHEQFARGFEKYLGEGVAPNKALKRAFARFKTWILDVYKGLDALKVNLTDDVRDVMGRLLVSEEQVNVATQAAQQYDPLFDDLILGGSDANAKASYLLARNESEQFAKAQVNKKLMADVEKKRSEAYRNRRNETKERVTNEVNKSQTYNAISILQDGTKADGTALPAGMPVPKIDKSSLTKEQRELLPRGIYAGEGEVGLTADAAAPLFGYNSGSELIETLSKAPPKKDYIESLTQQQMDEQYPELARHTSPQFSEEAVKAVHNDKRAEMLRMQLEHLAKNNLPVLKDVMSRVARRVPSLAIVRDQAQSIISSKAVGEIKPYLYQRAEVKAAREAGELLAKGDIDGAFESKRKELLNHELYRAAVESQENVENFLSKVKRIFRTDEDLSKTRDTDMVNAARAVLAQFGLAKETEKTADQYLKQLAQYDPDTYNGVKVLVDSATENAGPYKNVSYDDFMDMADSVQALWELSRSSKQMTIDGQKVSREEAIGTLQNRLSVIVEPGGGKLGYDKAVSKYDKFKIKLMAARAALTRVEHWTDTVDGGPSGDFKKFIWNPVSEGITAYRLQKAEVLKQFQTILQEHGKSLTREEIKAEQIGYTFRDKTELLMAILHTGNDSNKSKLLRGRNWGTMNEDGSIDSSRWDATIADLQNKGVLTKADYDFAQQVWNLMESLKPQAQASHKSMYGYYFNEISSKEFTTPFGTYKGGYIPAKVDIYTNEDAAIRNERESFEKNNNSYQFPTTGRGFTKSRVDAYAAPLSLELSLLGGHIDNVLRFIHVEPRVKDVGKIVMDKSFRASLAQLDPTVGKEMLVPWLQRAATQQVVTPSESGEGKLLDAFAKYMRKSVAVQIMFGGLTNAMQQLTGTVVAMTKVKPRHIRDGMITYIQSPKAAVEAVMEKSEYMKSTQGNNIYETQQAIQEIVVNPNTFEKMQDFTSKHTYFLQSATQNIVNTIVWTGAYNQAIENGVDENESVRQADSAVRLTQGTNSAEDISRFETGTATKRLFTQFAGYFNMLVNLNSSEVTKIARDVGLKKGAGKLFYVYMTGLAIPAILSEAIVKMMSGDDLDKDDDGYTNDLMSLLFGSQFKTATALIPFAGQAINAGINRFNDQAYDDRISLSPVISTLESAVGVPAQIYKAIKDDDMNTKRLTKDTLMLLGIASSLPVGPIGKPAGYLIDVAEGNAEPSGPIDFTRGLITGRKGQNK